VEPPGKKRKMGGGLQLAGDVEVLAAELGSVTGRN
jgi:hypothetical protein